LLSYEISKCWALAPFSGKPPLDVTLGDGHEIAGALNVLKSVQLLFSKFFRTIDLLILTVLSELMVHIGPFQIHRPDLFEIPNFGVLKYQNQLSFVLQYFGVHDM